MNLVQALGFNKPAANVTPSILQFPAVDTDGMIKKMRLSARAQERARSNLPASDGVGLDSIEQEIVNEIENVGKAQYDAYLQQQKTYVDRASDANIQSLVLKIGSTAEDAVTDFGRKTHVGTNILYPLKRDVVQTEQELNRFRKRHHLERPPRSYGPKTLKMGFLLLILVFEAVANGYFLSKGSTFGLVGGIGEALIIAGLNVVLGVAAGRIVAPWLAHRNWAAKTLAFIVLCAYVAVAVGFNLGVAHYRAATGGIDPTEAAVQAIKTLRANPLGIDDIQSWALFLMGFIFSIASAIDAWLMDDPYPGYGQRMRQNLAALEDYTDEKEGLLQELEEIKKVAEQTMDTAAHDIETRQGEFSYIVMKSQALQAAMAQQFAHLETSANTVLTFYRDENRKHRTGSPPSHFEVPWSYTRPALDTVIPPGIADSIAAGLKQALQEIPRRREQLHTGYRAALAEYKRIDDLTTFDQSA